MSSEDVQLFLDYSTIAQQPGPFSSDLLENNLLRPKQALNAYVGLVQGLQTANFEVVAVLVDNPGLAYRGAVGAAKLGLENAGLSNRPPLRHWYQYKKCRCQS